ncbi:N,N'-diacetylbacillosaminyl-diphospho-undecaprenol alpha-1,3-N-acetylgalactosaminyltransferase [Novipirellula galeiformis]|uniref:N, N'-diacetylbacillosaminyl-diphospho-undecaprenol alpha-1,3-N-acetylgalactosaminyltransferase n=1 Tax=Novipirellula galeiformis TaxID=2528004 RepID=A0A5C6CW57_9BACT|nr:glycosyltransferase [Novipirellula galeiformis]TWU26919.1 N,N'-diacetylbacillosaminyl-diphospho-undecaprenol alpha-1,3-N-acetylgalactosaminyltransferase [Novipirellula galeiformis]
MRIAFVITELNPGGAERCLTEIAIGMADNTNEVRVYSLGSPPIPHKAMFVDRLSSHGISVTFLNLDSAWHFLQARRELRKLLRAFQPALVQTFLFHANVIGTLAAKDAGVDICVGGIRVAQTHRIRNQVERRVVKKMQRVVCVSEQVQAFSHRCLGTEAPQTCVIPNGVDVPQFSSALPIAWHTLDWDDESMVTLFVGRMHPQKGLELIQEQIDLLAPPGSNRRVLLIGEGPLESKIDHWTRQVGLDRVKRLPWRANIGAWMRASRVLVLPSHYEGMPNVVLEAMAAGLPVVCSNVEGSSELLAHCPDDQLFESGDSDAMARQVKRFLDDAALSRDRGQRNQSRARTDFSIPTMVDRYRTLYRDLISRPN